MYFFLVSIADFCVENDLVIGENLFPHETKRKTTRVSSDHTVHNQIDHNVMIDNIILIKITMNKIYVGKKKSSVAEDSVNLHRKRIKIGNLIMEVVQGDITEEKTDVIVNSTDDSLNLSGGN